MLNLLEEQLRARLVIFTGYPHYEKKEVAFASACLAMNVQNSLAKSFEIGVLQPTMV
jgi:hypothetical protein